MTTERLKELLAKLRRGCPDDHELEAADAIEALIARIEEVVVALATIEDEATRGSDWNKLRTDTQPRDCHNHFARIIQAARRARTLLTPNRRGDNG